MAAKSKVTSLPQTCRDIEAAYTRLADIATAQKNVSMLVSASFTESGATYTVSLTDEGVSHSATHSELLEAFLIAQSRMAGLQSPPPF